MTTVERWNESGALIKLKDLQLNFKVNVQSCRPADVNSTYTVENFPSQPNWILSKITWNLMGEDKARIATIKKLFTEYIGDYVRKICS